MSTSSGGIGAVRIASTKPYSAFAAGTSDFKPACNRPATLASLFSEGAEDEDYDAATDWDVRHAAEADYEEPEQLVNDAGVPFEPFNLTQERQEGYFDRESGSYILLKKKDDVEDAWADALAAVEVDHTWASAERGHQRRWENVDGKTGNSNAAHRNSFHNALPTNDMSPEDIFETKQRIASLLLPGENTLAALRRLGRRRSRTAVADNRTVSNVLAAGGGGGARLSSPVEGREGLSPPDRESTKGARQTRDTVVRRMAPLEPSAQEDFNRLTEWSSLLMEAGEFLIHSHTREELLEGRRVQGAIREGVQLAEQLLAGAGASGGFEEQAVIRDTAAVVAAAAPSCNVGRVDEMKSNSEYVGGVDMFAEEEEEGASKDKKKKLLSLERRQLERCEIREMKDPAASDVRNNLGNTKMTPGTRAFIGSLPVKGEKKGPSESKSGNAQQAPFSSAEALQGFVLDRHTGYFYNSTLGAYYDPNTHLFGDAASGFWYRLDQATGQYILAG